MSQKTRLVVLGGGRYSKLIEQLAMDIGRHKEIVFYDDVVKSDRIQGPLDQAMQEDPDNAEFVVGVGYLHFELRTNLFKKFSDKFEFARLVHPASFVSSTATVEQGCCIFSNCNIEQGAHLKENVSIFNNTSITHDVLVGAHSFLSVGVNMGGGVIMGEQTFIGVGAVLINDFTIGNRVTICAGSVVSKDIPDDSTVVGNPMKVIGDVDLKREVLRGQ